MKTLSELKKELEFNRGLSSLIEVLKNVAVSQFKALEHKLTEHVKLMEAVSSFFEFTGVSRLNHPFLTPVSPTQIVVAVTSNTGLLGGLNMHVVATATRELEKIPGKLVVVGERGKAYAREAGLAFVAFPGINDEQRFSQAIQIRDYLIKKFSEAKTGYLKVIYPHPVSFTVQRVQVISFLPYVMPPEAAARSAQVSTQDIIFESNIGDIIEYLVYLWMGQRLYEIFGLSRLAEFAARFVHLEESSQRLKEMDKKIQLQYFRVRHELIDRNMRELFSARSIYAS